ncbi:MAG: InlB B-repeat-containing protein [Spirochaetaceae bacterium]
MRKTVLLIISSLLLTFVACELFQPQDKLEYTNINLSLPNSRSLSEDIVNYELVVTSSGMVTETYTSITDSISAEIPSGSDRTFTLSIYNDDNSILLYQGTETVDLEPGGTISLEITVSRTAFYITYDGNEATTITIPDTLYFEDNTSVTIAGNLTNLVYSGYTFSEWNTAADGNGTSYDIGDALTLDGQDITLYAIWAVEYDTNILFFDDFSSTGNLHGQSPDVGSGTWDVTFGGLSTSSGSCITSGTTGVVDTGFGTFTRAMASGEILTLEFTTSAITPFGNAGWAGISLFAGGTEKFYFGNIGGFNGWGIDVVGFTQSTTSPLLTTSAQVATFTYEYSSGYWTWSIAGQYHTGTGTSDLEINQVRIGGEASSTTDISVDSIEVTVDIAPPS